MKIMIKTITCLFVIAFFYMQAYSQTMQEKLVNDYGNYMSSWCSTKNDTYRIKLDELVHGDMGCRVDDGIMRIFAKQDKTGLLSKGLTFVDNYLNGFTHAIEDHLIYVHGNPMWQQNLQEPTAFTDKSEVPLFLVSMDIQTSGVINYKGTDLFFCRGGQITKIEDFNNKNSLSNAIALYSDHKYDEAFDLFRKIAYANPNNYDAQYYTAVMEIKKQGCGKLDAKVRDMEAAWWITRGVVSNSFNQEWSKEKMSKIYVRFDIKEDPLPYNTHGQDFYIMSLISKRLVTEGLMVYKKKGLYGFMNESGKIVVPCKYSLVYPFDKDGLALVVNNEKIGYINNIGEEIIPIIYKTGVPQFKDGKTYVILDDKLLLIDKTGKVLKEIGKGYDGLGFAFVGGKVFAHNKATNLYYLYDMNGNFSSTENECFHVDCKNCCYFTNDGNGNRSITESFSW
jgi:hypothetical protein